ncbi:hypothetical protein JB92DRAFT_2991416 [Gautieria morchelliformis]|nr:hypothetical protein JB92DRAFT_2991416 [Gautieria morchelliformis]
MPPRRRGHREKQADANATDIRSPKTERPQKQKSNLGRQHGVAAFRIIVLILFVYFTRRLNTDVKQFHDKVIPWQVTDLPGRGKGMIAIRPIKQGERILTEAPLFVVPRKISGSPTQLINSHLGSLSEEQQTAFLELSYVDMGSDIPEENIPLSIFQTNGISAGESGVGIFPKTARLNHACSAGFNSVYTWREKEKLLVVHALKEIQAGEELLTTYFDTKKSRDERRNYLAQTYKFNCSCQVCSLPPKESHASDLRLQSMSTSYNKFATWGRQEISGLAALDVVRNIWRTGGEEGYLSERGQLAADAAHIAAAHSDEHATRQWATLAEEWYGYELGEDSEQVKMMHAIIDNPRQHAAWASREHLAVGDLNYQS